MKYRHYGVPVGELVAEGNVGVVRALAGFEPERGLRFGTYAAFWVRARMLAYVVKSYSSVMGNDGPMRSQLFFKLRRERVRIGNQYGAGDAADQALAASMGVSPARLLSMLQRLDARDVSLDAKAPNERIGLLDRLAAPDDQEQLLLRCQMQDGLRQALGSAVAKLDARERYIIEHRLMAEAEEELSLAEIARTFKLSRERVRQLESRIKSKLRVELASSDSAVVRELIESQLSLVPAAKLRARRTPPSRRGATPLAHQSAP